MNSTTDVISGHIPSDIVYGPVNSRRFGRSLGLSFCSPTEWVCQWRCPYCQIAEQPASHDGNNPTAEILAALDAAREHWDSFGKLDVICIAGSGEPTDHPDFVQLLQAVHELANHKQSLPVVLLTNGDGLTNGKRIQAVNERCEAYLKVDPGPKHGCWRALSTSQVSKRHELQRQLSPLRWQSLLFTTDKGGNNSPAHMEQWLDLVKQYQPNCIDLTTVARPSKGDHCMPVARENLLEWAEAAEALGPAVRVL